MTGFLVTATPPTPNGDLHVGHVAGPYLGADVFTRAQRMLGHTVKYVSGVDDHQTYVVTTAQGLGREPGEFAAHCGADIRETLRVAGIDMDVLRTPDAAYRADVAGFFAELYDKGALARREWVFRYEPDTGRHRLEAFAPGYCRTCLATVCGTVCELCGHPGGPGPLYGEDGTVARTVPILVLPLEDYRERFVRFYTDRRDTVRPHVLRFVTEMLSRPLPDFPITYPADWGIPVTLDGYGGQVFNAWAEMLPGLVRSATDVWRAGSGYELVQFLGYDNTFYFSLAHLALTFAHGGLILPTAIVTNEFYHLDGAKFSTSRRHVIGARDLVVRHGADDARFYLALTNPELQTSDFSDAQFRHTVRTRLHDPLNAIAAALEPLSGRPVPGTAYPLLDGYRDRMRQAYSLPDFSIRRAAETTANLLALLAERTCAEPALGVHGLRAIAVWAAPLVPELAARIAAQYADPHTVPSTTAIRGEAHRPHIRSEHHDTRRHCAEER
ncbi:class I tRNA ligase family protein [Nocardia sp. BMG111209]|uniref:class I tRNA ligase family protein n=1 Tax=Nocardia sp. BMG111209 TaxID=1160137 RepID=UPI000373B54C|nr:class I tRNA ligase family protein [Nocardia sp. BMG111209]